jgi:hypothetical protein
MASHRAETRCLALEARINYEKKLYEELTLEKQKLETDILLIHHNSSIRPKSPKITQTNDSDNKLLHTELKIDLFRVITKADTKIQVSDRQIQIFQRQIRKLEFENENLLKRRSIAFEILGVPIPEILTQEVIYDETLQDLKIAENQLRVALSSHQLQDLIPQLRNEIEVLETKNSLRRFKLTEKSNTLKTSTHFSTHKFPKFNHNPIKPLSLNVLESSELINRVLNAVESRQESLRKEYENFEFIQAKFSRLKAQMKTQLSHKYETIKHLQNLELLIKKIQVQQSELSSLELKRATILHTRGNIHSQVSKLESIKASLIPIYASFSNKQKAFNETRESLAEHSELLEQMESEFYSSERKLKLLNAIVESLESQVETLTSRLSGSVVQ